MNDDRTTANRWTVNECSVAPPPPNTNLTSVFVNTPGYETDPSTVTGQIRYQTADSPPQPVLVRSWYSFVSHVLNTLGATDE